MATIRKLKSKKFLAEVRKLGQYKSKTFTTKVQAMAWAAETEQSLSSDILVLGKSLGDIFERYRDEITPHKKAGVQNISKRSANCSGTVNLATYQREIQEVIAHF